LNYQLLQVESDSGQCEHILLSHCVVESGHLVLTGSRQVRPELNESTKASGEYC